METVFSVLGGLALALLVVWAIVSWAERRVIRYMQRSRHEEDR